MLYLFAALVVIPLALNWAASRYDFKNYADAYGVSVMLVLFWIITNLMQFIFSPPTSKLLHPLIDFGGLAFCLLSNRANPEKWKVILGGLFLTQLGLHGLFWVEWATQPARYMLYNYQLGVNIVWLLELAVTGSPGGRYVVGRVVDWSLHRGRGHFRPGINP